MNRAKDDQRLMEAFEAEQNTRLNVLWNTMRVLEPDDPLYIKIRHEIARVLYPVFGELDRDEPPLPHS